MRFQSTAAMAAVVLMLTAGLRDARAQEPLKRPVSHPAGHCQPALPVFDGNVRKRPLAVANEGTSAAFVTCSFTTDGTSPGVIGYSMRVSNQSAAQIPMACTAVAGNGEAAQYYPKSVSLAAGASATLSWLAADNGNALYAHPISLSCLLPPGGALNEMSVVTSPGPASQTCAAVSQYGITWSFDRNYPCGQFANGDYWVTPNPGETAVTISQITPTALSGRHGWDVNPSGGLKIAYDSRLSGYDASLRPALPYRAEPGDSIVKGVSVPASVNCNDASDPAHTPCLTTAAVLTVLGSIPADNGANTFRPPYAGTDKTLFSYRQLQFTSLPSLASVSNAPALASIARRFQRVQLDHFNTWEGRYLHPSENYVSASAGTLETYGADISNAANLAALRLMLNDSENIKRPALINYVQAGIDYYGMHKAGVSWVSDGGHMQGRKLPAVFAAVLLNDAQMKNEISNAASETYGDDGHAYYSTNPTTIAAMLPRRPALFGKPCPEGAYQLRQTSNYTQGPGDCRDPLEMIDGGDGPADSYQFCCNSQPMKGASLAARLLVGGKQVWNYEAFHDYVDRWVTFGAWALPDNAPASLRPSYAARHGTARDGGFNNEVFVRNMWDAYRSTIATSSPPAAAVKSGRRASLEVDHRGKP